MILFSLCSYVEAKGEIALRVTRWQRNSLLSYYSPKLAVNFYRIKQPNEDWTE